MLPSLYWSRDEASHCPSTANPNSPPASSASSLPQALGVGGTLTRAWELLTVVQHC